MNTTWIKPPQPSVSLSSGTYDGALQPFRVFVAFDEAECASEAEVRIKHAGSDKSSDTELCRLKQLATLAQSNAVGCSEAEEPLLAIVLYSGRSSSQPVRTWSSRLFILRDDDKAGALLVLRSGTKAHPADNAELLSDLETRAALSRLEFSPSVEF
jgi:hypothetical protein